MEHLAGHYLLFVFIAACGVIQLAAAYSKLWGLLFFKKRVPSYIFAAVAIGGAFGWFFGCDNHMEEIMHTGLEGAQQVRFFLLATIVAAFFTLILSSVINRGLSSSSEQPEVSAGITKEGLDTLREENYLRALLSSIRGTTSVSMRKDKK